MDITITNVALSFIARDPKAGTSTLQWVVDAYNITLAGLLLLGGGLADALFVTYVCFTGMLFIIPQHLQDVRSVGVVATGLLLVPFALAFSLGSSRATRRARTARQAIGGALNIATQLSRFDARALTTEARHAFDDAA